MRGKAVGVMSLLIFLIASTSFAAVCPQVTSLGSLTGDGRYEPYRVAVDQGGSVYVTDARHDAVYEYGAGGDRVNKITIEYPLGIAVDESGTVYIGSSDRRSGYNGRVSVYDSGLNLITTIGEGTLKTPAGVAVDADRIYVADTQLNTVLVFSKADGSFLFDISTTLSGKLVRPDNVFVNPTTGNIIVTDRALAYDYDVSSDPSYITNSKGLGAGIHEFTRDGQFVRSFGTNGYTGTAGVLALIGGMTMDNAQRIFVSDRTMDSLHVFDNTGNAVCVVSYDFAPSALPQGLAATSDGRLFVGTSGQVLELGLDTFTKMVVSPTSLDFSAQVCGSQPASKTVTVSNEGPGYLSFTVSSDSAWLTASTASGEIDGQGSMDFSVSIDKSGLAEGTHTGTITVASAGSTQTVSVTLEVLPPSTLTVTPSSLSFSIEGGANPPAQSLSISLAGGGSWSATSSSAWLGVSPATGGTGTTLAQVSVDAASLGADRSGSITVDGTCIAGGPVVVPVTLDVISGGTINVSTNTDDSSFTITGPATYSSTGKDYTVSGAPAGTYTIEFGAVAGHIKPASYSLDLADGETVIFTGNYVDLRKKLNILAAPGGINGNGVNALNIFDGDGNLLGSIPLVDPATSDYFWENAIPAAGDVDGDGLVDIVISHDVGVITAFKNMGDGTFAYMPSLDFMPFEDRAYVDMSLADLDGDGKAEIVVSALNWSSNGAAVRVFTHTLAGATDTGVNFLAYTGDDWYYSNSVDRRGVRLATGDIDGDGVAEILTVQGGGYSRHSILVRMFNVDTTGGIGNWTVSDAGSFGVNDMESYYSDITAGDIDADGVDEIIVSDAPSLTATSQDVKVMAYSQAGERLLTITLKSIRGVEVAAADLNYDGAAEIVVGEGAFREGDSSRIRVFDAQGQTVSDFMAFGDSVYGVRVATGELIGN